MSDNDTMPAAITITFLAVLCAAGVFAILLVGRRPEEGWRAWIRSSLRAWRSDELSWVDADPVDSDAEVGGLGTLYQLSEPGNAYLVPPEDLEERISAVKRSRSSADGAQRSHAGHTGRPSHAG